MMQLLFNKGADISAVDARYLLLLVKSYLRHNAGCRGCTAINIAAEAGLLSNVEWLVNKGANINWRNAKRQTPLYAAASKNRLALQISDSDINTNVSVRRYHVVRYLLHNNALPNMDTQEGATPVFIAAQNGFVEVVKLLYKYKAGTVSCLPPYLESFPLNALPSRYAIAQRRRSNSIVYRYVLFSLD